MEYNRMVAYIYSYNNGLKNRNTGFARIEIRNDNVKIKINMKTAYTEGYSIWGIYLFFRRDNKVCGIKLGEMPLRGGMGEFTYTGNAMDIEKTNMDFDSVKGLFMISGRDRSHMFASEWDDLGFDVRDVEFEDEWNRPQIGTFREEPIDEPHSEEMIPEIDENNDSDRQLQAAEWKEPETLERESAVTCAELPQMNDDEYEDQLGRMWELISKDKDKLFIFADDELYDVVEITPEDIDKMPSTNWHLKNNSFVNHGYFNFRHLIVGKMNTDGKQGYFIGVPGIYNRRERAIANMYGFNRFKFSMRSDMRLNQFGYWYREITD